MGFAGQVFAARVAIGLAVPSPKALSKTGSILANGIKQIHKRIKLEQMRSNLEPEYKKKLDKLNRMTTATSVKTSNMIAMKLEQNLDRMNKKTNQSIKNSFNQTEQNYKRLRSVLGKPLKSVFPDAKAGLKGMEYAKQLAKNLAGISKRERNEIVRQQATITQQLSRQANRIKAQLADEKKMAKLSKTEIKELQKQLRTITKQGNKEKERLKTLRQIVGEVDAIGDEMKEIDDEGASIGAQFVDFANTLRDKFNEALRNSVALMTAMGFQLHRAANALVEFERELINANSVFNLTHDQLFTIGNEIMKFGNQYGIAVQNGAEGMYQLASAGVTANEAMAILPSTLKLSMAVQGDHNTISKLTAQTLFGFGMEMEEAAIVTDKFAYAIQKSLIEYQDLASAVKFALPFFTATGQSLDQLLGALQVLTNRALEAGIAGRGLRQAVAEFAESAEDAETGFRRMGVEILNSEGEMKQLTEIAADFAAAVGPDTASNTELLTTLIEDLNVRGATAFIHLVQASDEFTEAVENTANAGGELDAMIEEQNKSLSAQIQILKTNVLSIFAFRDAAYEGTEYLNAFHEALVEGVQELRDLIIEGEAGAETLTVLGQELQDLAVGGVEVAREMIEKLVAAMQHIADENIDWTRTLRLLAMPLEFILKILEVMPAEWLEVYIAFKMINSIIPISTMFYWGLGRSIQFVIAQQALLAMSGGGLGVGGMMGGAAGAQGIRGVSGKMLTGNYFLQGGGLNKAGKAAIARGGTQVGIRGAAARAAPWAGRLALGSAGLGVGVAALGLYGAYRLWKSTKEASGGYLKPMAAGGGVGAAPYLVGEQGPEMFIPSQGGQLLNSGETQQRMGDRMVLSNVTIGVDSFGGIV